MDGVYTRATCSSEASLATPQWSQACGESGKAGSVRRSGALAHHATASPTMVPTEAASPPLYAPYSFFVRPGEQHRFLDGSWAAASSSSALPSQACSWSSDAAGALSGLGVQAAMSLGLPSFARSESSNKAASRASEDGWSNPLNWSQKETNDWLWEHRTVVTAGTASLISTASSFPFDSLKSRLQVKHYPSIWACTKAVWREEGLGGFFRGVTIPLVTISFVRTSSFAIYVNTKSWLHKQGYLADKTKVWHTALSGMAGGATSGVIIRYVSKIDTSATFFPACV